MNLLSVSAIQLRRTLRRTSSRIFAQLILLLAGSPKYESDRKKGFQFNLSKNCFILTCMCKSSSSASLPRVFIKGMFTLSANLGVITGCTNGFWNQYIKNGTFCRLFFICEQWPTTFSHTKSDIISLITIKHTDEVKSYYQWRFPKIYHERSKFFNI